MTYNLDDKTLARHRAGQLLALSRVSAGRSFGIPKTDVGLRAVAFMPVVERSLDLESDQPVAVVGVVDIIGPLAQREEFTHDCTHVDGYDAVWKRYTAALDGSDTVVLRIDSPGGDVAGLFSLVERMREAADAAGKQVLAYVDEEACSAAYAIACAADKIYSPSTPSAYVGSIGVVCVYRNEMRAAQESGIDIRIFRSGEHKMDVNPWEEMPKGAAKRIQTRVDNTARTFADWVARRRGVSSDTVLGFGGREFSPAEGLEVGLIDAVATWEEVLQMAGKIAMDKNSSNKEESTASAAAAVPSVDINAHVMGLTGAKTPEEAVGILSAWSENSAALKTANAQLDVLHARIDRMERVQLLRSEVARGRITPAEAWANTEELAANSDAEPEPAPLWATAPIATMKAHLAARAPRVATKPQEAMLEPASTQASEAQINEIAARCGVEPQFVAAATKNIRWA